MDGWMDGGTRWIDGWWDEMDGWMVELGGWTDSEMVGCIGGIVNSKFN
jgi:hypothetical protein